MTVSRANNSKTNTKKTKGNENFEGSDKFYRQN